MPIPEADLHSLQLFQAGMGVNISSPELARATGQASDKLGLPIMVTISGTGAPMLVTSILQSGDPGEHYRRILQEPAICKIGAEVLDDYYRDPNLGPHRFIYPPNPSDLIGNREARREKLKRLLVASNYALVRRAKEGHSRPVGINFLTKIELTHLYELFGAQLAGVDTVVMGAGIPSQIPEILDRNVGYQPTSYQVEIANRKDQKYEMSFDPLVEIPLGSSTQLNRPRFILVTSYTSLAQRMHKQEKIDGVVMENYMAGGHNAAPRGVLKLNERGEPIYGEKDEPNFNELVKDDIPFWLAGGYAHNLQGALELGARGIQAGTIFALSKESGMDPAIRKQLLQLAFTGELDVKNDPVASPTGFPIEIAQLKGTLSDPEIYAQRMRACTLGYLVELYIASNGKVATRCPAEPIGAFLGHGGRPEDALNRMCLCNGLLASAGFGIQTKHGKEPPVVTLGKVVNFVPQIINSPNDVYTTEDALQFVFKLGRFAETV